MALFTNKDWKREIFDDTLFSGCHFKTSEHHIFCFLIVCAGIINISIAKLNVVRKKFKE
jgi:hypothetical protein